MSILIACDRCGNHQPAGKNWPWTPDDQKWEQAAIGYRMANDKWDKRIDLCPDCVKAANEFFNIPNETQP